MKKVLGLASIVILGIVGYFGYNYYNETYMTETAFALVPNDIPARVATTDIDGKEIGNSYSFHYTVTFVKKNGAQQKMDFELLGKDPQPFKPGAYIKAEISKERVNSPKQISENEVPDKIKKKLVSNNLN